MEVKNLYSAPKYLQMLRQSANENQEALAKPKIGKTVKYRVGKSTTVSPEPVSKLIEKLRSFKNLSSEEFERIFQHKSGETTELYKILSVQLPLMSDDTLIKAIDFANSQFEKDWAFRARCVAEAFKRCPKILGGRHKKAKDGEGRGNLVKLLAEKFNTSETNIRLDERIHRTFSQLTEIKTSADSAEVLNAIEKNEFTVTRSADNQHFVDIVQPSPNKDGTLNVFTFIPHPQLTREHYIIALRLNYHYARAAIDEAITEVEAGNVYTAADMEKKYFPRKVDRPGHIRLYRADLPKSVTKLELSFDEADKEILCEALAKALGIPSMGIMKGAAAGSAIEERGFDCFMGILKAYIELN